MKQETCVGQGGALCIADETCQLCNVPAESIACRHMSAKACQACVAERSSPKLRSITLLKLVRAEAVPVAVVVAVAAAMAVAVALALVAAAVVVVAVVVA